MEKKVDASLDGFSARKRQRESAGTAARQDMQELPAQSETFAPALRRMPGVPSVHSPVETAPRNPASAERGDKPAPSATGIGQSRNPPGTSCAQCYRHHKRCSGTIPCQRCLSRNIPCSYQHTSPAEAAAVLASSAAAAAVIVLEAPCPVISRDGLLQTDGASDHSLQSLLILSQGLFTVRELIGKRVAAFDPLFVAAVSSRIGTRILSPAGDGLSDIAAAAAVPTAFTSITSPSPAEQTRRQWLLDLSADDAFRLYDALATLEFGSAADFGFGALSASRDLAMIMFRFSTPLGLFAGAPGDPVLVDASCNLATSPAMARTYGWSLETMRENDTSVLHILHPADNWFMAGVAVMTARMLEATPPQYRQLSPPTSSVGVAAGGSAAGGGSQPTATAPTDVVRSWKKCGIFQNVRVLSGVTGSWLASDIDVLLLIGPRSGLPMAALMVLRSKAS